MPEEDTVNQTRLAEFHRRILTDVWISTPDASSTYNEWLIAEVGRARARLNMGPDDDLSTARLVDYSIEALRRTLASE